MMTVEIEKNCDEKFFICGFLFDWKSQLLPLLDIIYISN